MHPGPASHTARRAAQPLRCAVVAALSVVASMSAAAQPTARPAEPRRVPLTRTSLPERLGRQISASVDAGAATVTYDDFLNSSVASLTPTLRVENARALLVARSSFSRFQSGSRATQTSLSGSLVSPELFGVRGEVFGTGAVTRFARELAATNVYGAGRVHAASLTAGGWAGGGLGLVSQRNLLPDQVAQLDFGAWTREGPFTVTLTLQPTRVASLAYVDATAGVRWQGTRGELAVNGGNRSRAAERLPGVRAWAEGWGTLWLGTRVALVGGAGAFPFDPIQGLPGGRYVSAAIRLATRRAAVDDPALRAELLLPYEVRRLRAARAERFIVDERSDGSRVLRVLVPRAARVEIMGDFTDWTPVSMVRLDRRDGSVGGRSADGEEVWAVELVIAPGVHRLNLRVDGGTWRPPPGLSVVRDEFGGEVGLLVVR